jgi:lysozyme
MYLIITPQTLHFVEGCEGCRLKAYKDSRGIWTIGVGMTMLNGRPVKSTDVITQTQADQMFRSTAQYTQDHVLGMVNPIVKPRLTANHITALTSLAYNIGLGGFEGSTVLRKLNTGDFKGAADAFLKWTRAGGDKTALLSRREKERGLFLS